MIDLHNSFAVRATRMPWGQIEANLAPLFAYRERSGCTVEGSDLFGPTQFLVSAVELQ
jgi:IS5 family transposase